VRVLVLFDKSELSCLVEFLEGVFCELILFREADVRL
jgi:hypothetical protein